MSPGEQLLDMFFISDVCTAYEQAYNLLSRRIDIKNEVFGVYTNDRRPLKDIVEFYRRIIGKPIHINFGDKPYKKREVMKPTDKLELLPNWEPQISLEEGLLKVAGGGKGPINKVISPAVDCILKIAA